MKLNSKLFKNNRIKNNTEFPYNDYNSALLQTNINFHNYSLNGSNYISTIRKKKQGPNLSLYFIKPKNPYFSFHLIRNKIKSIRKHKKEFLNTFYSNSLQKSNEKNKFIKTMNFNNINNISKINTNDVNYNNNSSNIYFDSSNYNQNSIRTAFNPQKKQNLIYNFKSTINNKDLTPRIGSPYNNKNDLSTQFLLNKSNNIINYNLKSVGKELYTDNNKINFTESETTNCTKEYYGEKIQPKAINSKNKTEISFFSNEMKLSIKAKYINYYLKIVEYENMRKKELNFESLRLEINSLLKLKKLITKYLDDFSNYYKYTMQTLEKEKTYNEFLKYDIITKKNEINHLNNKKNKLLSRLENNLDIKNFLINVRMYYNKQVKLLDEISSNKTTQYNYHKIFSSIREEFNRNNPKGKIIKFHRQSTLKSVQKMKYKEIRLEKKSKKNLLNTTSNKNLDSSKNKNTSKHVNFKENRRGIVQMKLKHNNSQFLNRNNKPNFISPDDFINKFSSIKHNIGTLLTHKTKLEDETEYLRKEYTNIYNSIEEIEHKYKKEIEFSLIIIPQKLKIATNKNKFLINKLNSIQLNYSDVSFGTKYMKIEMQLKNIYNNILKNDILPVCDNQDEIDEKFFNYKKKTNNETVQNIFFYLHKIEVACNILKNSKNELKLKYHTVYNVLKKKLLNQQRINNFENRKKEELKIKKIKAKLMIEKLNKVPLRTKGLDYYINDKLYKKQKCKSGKKKLTFSDEINEYFG